MTSLAVGLVIGAVGTLGYQAYQVAGEDVQELTNDNTIEAEYGVGGGDVLPELDEAEQKIAEDTPKASDDAKTAEKENDAESEEDGEKTGDQEQENTVQQQEELQFRLPAITQPRVTEVNAESTLYEYGGDNTISILSGDTADIALSTTGIGTETEAEISINGTAAREITSFSPKDGTQEQVILIEQGDQVLMVTGDAAFIDSVKNDLTL